MNILKSSLITQEFPCADDVCYFAHCYPYTFTDLKRDLDTLTSDPSRSPYISQEVLCETRAGNSCFVLTVTNPGWLKRDDLV